MSDTTQNTIEGLIDKCEFVRKYAKIAYEQGKEDFDIRPAQLDRIKKLNIFKIGTSVWDPILTPTPIREEET